MPYRTSAVVRVLIADDHLLFAEALAAILTIDGRIEVVGHAADGEAAIRLAHELHPDVVVMDLSMPRGDGFDATRQIREAHPGTHVLVLTGSAAGADVARAREAGANGYLTKDQIADDLVRAILAAAED
jgi:DNA-binding NarL/FixJ family response regulator